MSIATVEDAARQAGAREGAGRAGRQRWNGTLRYIGRRLLFYLGAAWVAITLNFVIPRLMPGSPAQTLINELQGKGHHLSPGSRAAIEQLFGAPHESILIQYLRYLDQVVHLNFGLSVAYYPVPVWQVISGGLLWTVCLVGIATILAFLIGTTLGIVAGWRPGTTLDSLMMPTCLFLGSLPYFWVGLILLVVLSVDHTWLPSGGGYDFYLKGGLSPRYVLSILSHALLPAATIVVSSMGGWLLLMRNMMITTVSEDYVLLARAKGLAPWRVMFSYAARNAVLPSVASLATSIGFIVGGSLLVEVVFAYPGVGYLLYTAVASNDYSLMQALFLIISLSVLAANFIADSIYGLVDPRARESR